MYSHTIKVSGIASLLESNWILIRPDLAMRIQRIEHADTVPNWNPRHLTGTDVESDGYLYVNPNPFFLFRSIQLSIPFVIFQVLRPYASLTEKPGSYCGRGRLLGTRWNIKILSIGLSEPHAFEYFFFD